MFNSDLSAETLQARREWQDILKVLKKEKFTTKITLPSKDLIQNLWRNKKLFRQAKVKRIQTKPALQQMLKGLI